MRWFRRKPRITDDNYGRLMTSFGRVVDRDPFIAEPATALADRVAAEQADLVGEVDERLYRGAAVYHLRLLAVSTARLRRTVMRVARRVQTRRRQTPT